MDEDFGEKSQEATPHRRQQAREEGQVVKSQDLESAVLLLGALFILLYFGGSAVNYLAELTRGQLGGEPWLSLDRDQTVARWTGLTWKLGGYLLPMLGLLLIVAIGANLGQVGFLWLPQKLALDLGRISPLRGAGRLFSLSNLMRLVFGLFKVAVVVGVAVYSLWDKFDQILALGSLELSQAALFVTQTTLWTCFKIAGALLALAIGDYAYQRWRHERELRMTPQEVREEMKTLQGDPQIIARRRAVQRQLVLHRLSTAVPKADVVVTNPTELAVAIQYDMEKMEAPVVVAKGAGVVAQRIRRLALEHNIPIVERKELARVLHKEVDIDRPIPLAQYAAVAEILRYVYRLKGKTLPKAA
jgi:flagellar biosynthetic protein FlhB